MRQFERIFTPGTPPTQELIGNILSQRDSLKTGGGCNSPIRTVLIIGAGAMRGVYAGGVVTALEELGLTETFDDVIGISAGAAVAAYFLAGQAELGTRAYSEELASKDFIDPLRKGNILNVGLLDRIFTLYKPLDQKAIQKNRSVFHIGVTDIASAKSEYVKIGHGNQGDLVKLIQASSSVPGLTQPIEINDTLYGDGVITCKNPGRYAIDVLGATDILYVMNQPLRIAETTSLGEIVLSKLLTRGYGRVIQAEFLDRNNKSDESGSTVYEDDVRIGILCPLGKPIGRLAKNSDNIRAVARQARLQTLELFS